MFGNKSKHVPPFGGIHVDDETLSQARYPPEPETFRDSNSMACLCLTKTQHLGAHRLPVVSTCNVWRASGGGTSERGSDSPQVDFRGIADSHGRLMVVTTHNSDIGDAMEREAEDPEFFAAFSPQGYQVTINMVLYALTH